MTMQSPGDVSPNFPFTVNGTIKNIGSQPAVASSPGITARFRLSVDSVLWNWDEAELGQFVVRGPGQPIHPGEVVPFSFVLGPVNGAVITGQTLFGWADSAGLLCEGSEENNLAQTPVGVSCPDVYVASFSPPSNWVGGQTRNYRVRVGRNNHAPDSLTVDVRVDLLFADGQVWSWNRLANVPRGTEIDVDVPATAPMVNANAGDSLPFLTKVTLSLPNGFGGVNCDENIANNVQSIWVPIAAPYFDLRLEVLGPSSAQRNSWVNYTVRVENHGNASQAWEVCGAATIGLNPGAVGIPFDLCLPASLNVNFLDPGESITIPFFCFIPGNAASRQYMKAVLWTFGCQNGCADCFANGNYAHKELTIY
jgi:hypothetical protein